MDAGLVNGLSSMVASALPKSSTSSTKNDGSAVSSAVKTPVADTVEISSQAQSVAKVFDPTSADGPYEQKHIGGDLATSSAKDGYNGWEAMLKYMFGIQNGGDKSDMPVISKFSYMGVGPNTVSEGYVPANQLTNKERNLIANMFVYAHDQGMSEISVRNIVASSVWTSDQIYHVQDFNATWDAPMDESLHIPNLQGRAATVEYVRQGSVKPPVWFSQPEEVTQTIVDTLSSSALTDNLIPSQWIENSYGIETWGDFGHDSIDYYKEEQRLIFAYSPSHASGSVAEKGMQSAAAQRYIAFHEAGKAQWQGILDEAKQPSSGVSGIPGAVGGESKVSSDPKDVFAKYADRLEGLADALNNSQKATLGMMYKLASEKGGEDSMKKVDALAKAFATANFMEVMLLPGKDKDGKSTTNLLDMLVWTKDIPNQADFLQSVLNKKNEAAIAKVEEKLGIDLGSKAGLNKPTTATSSHIDTEA